MIAAFAAVLCSFTYVVAQIYGVGLITSRLTGVQFEIGILLGLGGVLLLLQAIDWFGAKPAQVDTSMILLGWTGYAVATLAAWWVARGAAIAR